MPKPIEPHGIAATTTEISHQPDDSMADKAKATSTWEKAATTFEKCVSLNALLLTIVGDRGLLLLCAQQEI